jgi:predicted enzyme related to lactoylglutathione lyase
MRAHVVIDSQDPDRVTPFWCGLLDVQVSFSRADSPYVALTPASGEWMLVFQRVPEPKTGKNRLHLDVLVDDLDDAMARVEALGGRWAEPGNTHEVRDIRWRCMADPEGNEFCIWTQPAT